MRRDLVRATIFLALLAMGLFLATEILARGRGGGRGGGFHGGGRPNISRGGPASHGSLRGGSVGGYRSRPSTRPSYGNRPGVGDRPANRPDRGDRFEERQDRIDQRQEDRQDYRREAREDWQDYGDNWYDHHDWYEDRWKFAVGASLTAATFRALSCQTSTIVVNGVTYYNCGGTWYNQAYSGGSVTYIVVNPPPGY